MPRKLSVERGMVFDTNAYGRVRVIDAPNHDNIVVKFLNTGYKTRVNSGNLRNGRIKDPYAPMLFGIGYLGVGKYKPQVNGSASAEWTLWKSILQRVTFGRAYGGVTLSDEWCCFQQFARDVTKLPNFATLGFELDKDLRVFGSRVYSKETCSFVPTVINRMLVKSGIRVQKSLSKYVVQHRKEHLGTFDTEEAAQRAYLIAKLKHIRATVKQYKHDLHKQVYRNIRGLTVESLAAFLTRK